MGKFKPNRKQKFVVVPGVGERCPRCRGETEIREHDVLTEKHFRQPFYYSRWFYCNNGQCKTTLIMPDKFKVMKPRVETDEERRLRMIKEQLRFNQEVRNELR
jgi:hypothetical protein